MALIKYLILKLLLFLVIENVLYARCPNGCSGHGHCSLNNKCICLTGWKGGAVDCSQRECPYGLAWFDKAYATDSAHVSSECSNNGLCDRSTGTCKCFDGFEGVSCNKNKCDCSGHGSCLTMADMSYYNGYDTYLNEFGGYPYYNWEKDSLRMCECIDGYFGPDCSLKMCPKGDDPETINQQHRQIKVNVFTYTPLFLTGRVGIQFNGEVAYISLTDPSACNTTLSYNGPFGQVACTHTRYSYHGGSILFTLEFLSWPTLPSGNNMYGHFGNPSISDFHCDLTQATRLSTCEFSDLITVDIKEYAYCSNRGACNFNTGLCSCFDGYSGTACGNATDENIGYGANSLPGLLVNANGNNFVSDVLMLVSDKAKAPDFYFMKCIASSDEVFSIRGDGNVKMYSLNILDDGIDVYGGGMMITSGSVTIINDGIHVYQQSLSPIATFTTQDQLFLSSSYSAFTIAGMSSSTDYYLLSASSNGVSRFNIRSDGQVGILSNGLSLSMGLTINSGGIAISAGMSLQSGGLVIQSGGFRSTGGLTARDVGVKLYRTGAQLYDGGITISNSGLKVHAGGLSIATGGFILSPTLGGMTVNSGGMRVSDGITVLSIGVFVTSGITIGNDGLVSGQSIQVLNSFGMTVSGGITIALGGLYLPTSGVTVQNDGIMANTITSESLGIKVTTGITVRSFGILVSGGISISDTGGSFNYLEALDNGILVTGGVTANSGIVKFATMVNGGAVCFGNFDAQGNKVGTYHTVNGGVYVANGLTFTSVGLISVYGTNKPLFQSIPIIFSDRRLKNDIVSIGNALNKVSKIRGVYFNWIQNEPSGLTFDNDRHVGVMAQQVLSVLPEAVDKKSHSKYLGLNYANLVPLLIEAIHELKNQLSNNNANKQKELKIEINTPKKCDYSIYLNKTNEVRHVLKEEMEINNKLTKEVKALQMKISFLRLHVK